MHIKGLPGEFAFRALIYNTMHGWYLSDHYFMSEFEIKNTFGVGEVRWPVEVFEDGSVYIPDNSELE